MSAALVLTFVNAATDLIVAVAIATLFRYRRDRLTLYLMLAFATWFLNWSFDALHGLGVSLPHVLYYNLSTLNSLFLWLAAGQLDAQQRAAPSASLPTWRALARDPVVLVSGAVLLATLGLWFFRPDTRLFAYPELALATFVSLRTGLAVFHFIRPTDPVVAWGGLLTFAVLAALVVGYVLLELECIDYPTWYLRFKLVSVLAHLFIIYILAHVIARGLWRRLLAHQQERERLALAEQRAKTLSVLSSGTVHHFHNKLLAIRTGLRFLQGRMGLEQAHGLKVPMLLKAVDQAFALSQQLAGTLRTARESDFEVVDLQGALARAIEGSVERRPPGYEVALRVEGAGEVAPALLVRGVPAFVQMAFENLVNNAYDACRSGQVGRLEVALSVSADATWARVDFHDNGRGLPEAIRAQLFVPFFTTKEDAGGTGFGLYWSRRLIESMGGRLGLDWSELGLGARFVIELPLHPAGLTAEP